MSLLHTAELDCAQPFDCLVAIQRNHALVEKNPEEWMPWYYSDTRAGLALAGRAGRRTVGTCSLFMSKVIPVHSKHAVKKLLRVN
jgi:hypothetical protein